jgi:NhaA family Na+:H+ antiporter
MSIFRSERLAAAVLLTAAALGLIAANSFAGPALVAAQNIRLGVAGTSLELSIGRWISDGLLAVFFFVVAIELKHELTAGQLNNVAKAARPAIAALGGVLVPIILYLAFTSGSGHERGWPVPTATDIAFALGVLAVFGKGLPARLKAFLLALAVLDDIVAIVIIAVFFTTDPNLLALAFAVIGVAIFGVLSRFLRGPARVPVAIAMIVIGVLTWGCVSLSGVHATIAGVALGLVMVVKPGMRVRHALEPFSNGFVLPLFAFSAALVVLPQVGVNRLSAPFWAILIALPVGKLLGIVLGGWLSSLIRTGEPGSRLNLRSLITVGALGGIGFTVSLLMNDLAFANSADVAAEGTLGVLLGSAVSVVVSAVLVASQARSYRRAATGS